LGQKGRGKGGRYCVGGTRVRRLKRSSQTQNVLRKKERKKVYKKKGGTEGHNNTEKSLPKREVCQEKDRRSQEGPREGAEKSSVTTGTEQQQRRKNLLKENSKNFGTAFPRQNKETRRAVRKDVKSRLEKKDERNKKRQKGTLANLEKQNKGDLHEQRIKGRNERRPLNPCNYEGEFENKIKGKGKPAGPGVGDRAFSIIKRRVGKRSVGNKTNSRPRGTKKRKGTGRKGTVPLGERSQEGESKEGQMGGVGGGGAQNTTYWCPI